MPQIKNFIGNRVDFSKSLTSLVDSIIFAVEQNGESEIIAKTNQFDHCNFKTAQDLIITENEIETAYNNVLKTNPSLIEALEVCYDRVYEFHTRSFEFLVKDFSYQDKFGNSLGYSFKSIEKVGIYVPGGKASYPSSLIMSFIPAVCAGVENIFISTPSKSSVVNDAILATIQMCKLKHPNKIKHCYKVGGALAVAGFCYGHGMAKVDKIVGPGGPFVSIAKRLLFGKVGIDMIAGPTDLTVVACGKNDNQYKSIALGLMAQLEHGEDSRVFLITESQSLINSVEQFIMQNIAGAKRGEIISHSLANSCFIKVAKIEDSAQIVNEISPEHLQVIIDNKAQKDLVINGIKNAGAIFIGKHAHEALGDYILGPSHVLPTGGSARFSSGLSVIDFIKKISIMDIPSEKSVTELSRHAATVAESEGLQCHAESISQR